MEPSLVISLPGGNRAVSVCAYAKPELAQEGRHVCARVIHACVRACASRVRVRALHVRVFARAHPKSPILRRALSSTNTFDGFRSRCTSSCLEYPT